MTLLRTTPLPKAPSTGHLAVTHQVLSATEAALQAAGGKDGPHEGLVYWLGRRSGSDTYAISMVAPEVDSGPKRVVVRPREVGRVARLARRHRLVVVAQVHSHPGADTRHSDGDDELVLMPHEGLFSIVVARYGHGTPFADGDFTLHQFQGRRWVIVDDVEDALLPIPAALCDHG